MAKTPGLSERVRGRFQELGYWKDGRPDVGRFCEEYGYQSSYVYRWLRGETPRGIRLIRLARDLGVSVEWLLGSPPLRRVRRVLACLAGAYLIASGGVPASARTLQLVENKAESALSAVRRWRSRYFPRQGFPRLVPARLCA